MRRLIAVLTIRDRERFHAYETSAARIMAKHGGAIEHAYALEDARELHVVRFPDDAAFDAYRADPELAKLAGDRAIAVISSEIWAATELPPY